MGTGWNRFIQCTITVPDKVIKYWSGHKMIRLQLQVTSRVNIREILCSSKLWVYAKLACMRWRSRFQSAIWNQNINSYVHINTHVCRENSSCIRNLSLMNHNILFPGPGSPLVVYQIFQLHIVSKLYHCWWIWYHYWIINIWWCVNQMNSSLFELDYYSGIFIDVWINI